MDIDLARRIGEALGEECRARGVHCLLGPTTNCQRHPCGGRGFESFSEGESPSSIDLSKTELRADQMVRCTDPLLCGHIALAWIEGVQSKKVMTSACATLTIS